jgi:hypothetical protein
MRSWVAAALPVKRNRKQRFSFRFKTSLKEVSDFLTTHFRLPQKFKVAQKFYTDREKAA